MAEESQAANRDIVVSVIMPAFNAAAFIAQALNSVLQQQVSGLEVLVVDDGSTDATADVVAHYGPPVRLLQQRNSGPAAARNLGLRQASGRYVAFLDADDRWLPGKLQRQIALLDNDEALGFCSTATQLVDPEGNPLGIWPCCPASTSLLTALFVNGSTISGSTSGVLARRRLVEQVGGFDESLRGFEDPDLWIRLSAVSGYACIPEALTVVVRTPGSVSSNLSRMRSATLNSLRKNRALLPPALRGAFWRSACAGALSDYAKMAWRSGQHSRGIAWAIEALARSPLGQGRLALGLLAAMIFGRSL